MRIVIAGASGFVGTQLIRALSLENDTKEVVALSRSPMRDLPRMAQWRETDLFSAGSTRDALRGADVAVYLVHSMMPSTRLFQGDFHDTDLLLADNFARACSANRVRRIVYLGGLVPSGHVSRHLESRHEVGDVLRATGIPVTELRAGMIVGPGGSSFEILRSLVERLPVMILPEWTQRRTQAIFIDDVTRVLAAACRNSNFEGRILDLVNGESLTYEALLRQMAETLGLRRSMLPVPIRSTEFSKRWVTLFGGASYELVSPLIDSLLCDLPASIPDPLIGELVRHRSFRSMARDTLKRPAAVRSVGPSRRARAVNSVRSIQRLPSLPGRDCRWISAEYMRWLPALFRTWIRVDSDPASGLLNFRIAGFSRPLLELKYVEKDVEDRADRERTKFHIVGGWLSRTTDTGWLEFRQVQQRRYTLAAIHEFVPSLPWFVYRISQALLHRWVMHRFGRHLDQVAATESGTVN